MNSRRKGSTCAIEVQGLHKAFGPLSVLRRLSLRVEWGECLVLLGPNGSGKTTLLKVLATLARPDAGQVQVAGYDQRQYPAHVRAAVGMLGHHSLLYDELTPEENLRFYGRLYSVAGLEQRIAEVLKRVGMAERRRQRVRTMSHGMQRRVALARAILHDPPVLLLDEPESGLDQEALSLLKGILKGTVEHGGSVLMSTHNLEQGLALGDRIAILAGGRIAYLESARTLDAAAVQGAFRRHTGASL
ncbi:MAG: heme ABC exporter ATP-binding protein CcmA [Chloroflexi bacterium]|nr:heme ABC exporter ATP-binding protein CcmA [Chloroflexota bacterium]